MVIIIVVVAVVGVIALASFYYFATSSTSNLRLPRTVNIVNGLITVQAGQANYYQFTVPASTSTATLVGTLTVSGGSGNYIELLVMDHTNFVNWQNHNQYSTHYDSGQVTTHNFSVPLPISGTYDLIYSNMPSTISKNVQTSANLYYVG